jgi:hypothetical protein
MSPLLVIGGKASIRAEPRWTEGNPQFALADQKRD